MKSYFGFKLFFKGWSVFSSSASKIATKATENAIKIGGYATQKVSEISETVGDKVCFYFLFLSHFHNFILICNNYFVLIYICFLELHNFLKLVNYIPLI